MAVHHTFSSLIENVGVIFGQLLEIVSSPEDCSITNNKTKTQIFHLFIWMKMSNGQETDNVLDADFIN